MHVFVTGGTGHVGSYIIPDLIAAGHEVTALARSDESAAAVSALGAKVRRGDIADLDGLKAAAAESDGVIHVAHRAELLPSGGIDAVGARSSDRARVRRGAGGHRKAAGRGGEHRLARTGAGRPVSHRSLGRPATEDDPALPGGDAYTGTLRVRNVVETRRSRPRGAGRAVFGRADSSHRAQHDRCRLPPATDRAREGEGRHRLPRRRRKPVAGRAQPRPGLLVPPGAGKGSGRQKLARDRATRASGSAR